MQKWRKAIFLLAGVLAVGVTIVLLTRDSEPSYQGRSLSECLAHLGQDSIKSYDVRKDATEAIQHIGTNAIPWLLQYMRYTPPAWRLKWAEVKTVVILRMGRDVQREDVEDRRLYRARGAIDALCILGQDAEVAIPDLVRLMDEHPERAGSATMALGFLGPKALTPLLTMLTNDQFTHRHLAAWSLARLGTNARPQCPPSSRSSTIRIPRRAWRSPTPCAPSPPRCLPMH